MTFDSTNRKMLESSSLESIVSEIRLAMEQGCIRPCRLYDAVDELICRALKLEETAESCKGMGRSVNVNAMRIATKSEVKSKKAKQCKRCQAADCAFSGKEYHAICSKYSAKDDEGGD